MYLPRNQPLRHPPVCAAVVGIIAVIALHEIRNFAVFDLNFGDSLGQKQVFVFRTVEHHNISYFRFCKPGKTMIAPIPFRIRFPPRLHLRKNIQQRNIRPAFRQTSAVGQFIYPQPFACSNCWFHAPRRNLTRFTNHCPDKDCKQEDTKSE